MKEYSPSSWWTPLDQYLAPLVQRIWKHKWLWSGYDFAEAKHLLQERTVQVHRRLVRSGAAERVRRLFDDRALLGVGRFSHCLLNRQLLEPATAFMWSGQLLW